MKASDFILSEAFDSDVKGKLIKRTNDLFITQATIGNRIIRFQADYYNGEWGIAFVEKGPKGDTFGKSGSGKEMQVFSFVIESLRLLIAIYTPETIYFTSDKSDTNRSKLYRRIAARIKLPGYHLEVGASSGYDEFYIRRDK